MKITVGDVKRQQRSLLKKSGRGILNKLIDKLPIELHFPKYQFCGPGNYE